MVVYDCTPTRGLLDGDAAAVGASGSWTVVDSFADRPPRAKGTVVEDAGDGGAKIAEFLSTQKFI